jgi:hypothetical protein
MFFSLSLHQRFLFDLRAFPPLNSVGNEAEKQREKRIKAFLLKTSSMKNGESEIKPANLIIKHIIGSFRSSPSSEGRHKIS